MDSMHENGEFYHPGMQPLRSPVASRKYIMKDGNFHEKDEFNNKARSP